MANSQISGVWTCSERKLHINVLELKTVILAFQHRASVLQGHHVMIATDNTTVVAYINKQGGTHSHTTAAGSGSVSMATVSRYSPLGQTHSGLPQCDSREVISAEPAHQDRVVNPIFKLWGSSSGHVCHSTQLTSSSVYVSSSGAKSTGDRCSVIRLAETVDVNVSTVSPAQQSFRISG